MDTQAVANRLVELCRKCQFLDASTELYADNIVSVEAMAGPHGTRETAGKSNVLANSAAWVAANDVHGVKVEDPLVAGAHFCVSFTIDMTPKASGQRMQFVELGVYQVADGKVIREEFFYA